MSREWYWLSAVVMHHPSRSHRIGELIGTGSPLPLRVVQDPDPSGIPSPLRTAKVAWSAVAEGATHHLVLQDDVVLPAGFAEMVADAIRHRPDAGIALYVNWNSPHNSYYARRAAALGYAWAPLSRWEYTPCLGFVLPASCARLLAKFLSSVPDDSRDDDESITRFCRDLGLPVYATVPNLVQHVDGPSLAGYDFHGMRRSVAFAGDQPGPVGWAVDQALDAALARHSAEPRHTDYVIDVTDGRCTLHLLRPALPEPVDHQYGWYWHDWCPLIGVDPNDIVAGFHQWRAATGAPLENLLLEAWAAGYLLAADVTLHLDAAGAVDADAATAALAMRSWARTGLGRHASPEAVEAFAESCLEGLRHGARSLARQVPSYA